MIKISTARLGIISVLILFAGIGVSMLAGVWNVSSTKTPATIKAGDFAGNPDPADIRGSYTWNDVTSAFGVPADLLVQAFGASSATDKVNLLEALWLGKLPEGTEIGTDSVRLFVSLYTGLPHTTEEGTLLPASAIVALRQAGKGDPAVLDALSKTAPDNNVVTPVSIVPSSTDAGQSSVPLEITGKVTFRDLKNAGYDMAKVEAAIGQFGSLDQSIKTWSEGKGIEFSITKEKLAVLAPGK
jgi:hypothetical protein